MISLVSGSEVGSYRRLMDRAYRFRHAFFVEHLRWTDLAKPDGREIDQFDTEHCLHVIGTDGEAVTSYTRLLPTTRPHLLSAVYPGLLAGAEAPSGPHIWEWTRMGVDPKRREGRTGTDRCTAEIYLGVAEACLLNGIEALLIETHPVYLTRILEAGWLARPLALPQVHDGHPVVPIYAGVNEATLARSRQLFGIDHSVIEPARRDLPEDAGIPLEAGRHA